jgi:hypothetical protein
LASCVFLVEEVASTRLIRLMGDCLIVVVYNEVLGEGVHQFREELSFLCTPPPWINL